MLRTVASSALMNISCLDARNVGLGQLGEHLVDKGLEEVVFRAGQSLFQKEVIH